MNELENLTEQAAKSDHAKFLLWSESTLYPVKNSQDSQASFFPISTIMYRYDDFKLP